MNDFLKRLRQAIGGFLFILLLSSCGTEKEQRITIERGDRIVAGIDSYHSASNKFPQTLEELVANHINKIEEPLLGNRKWVYVLYEDCGLFDLGVEPVEEYSLSKPSSNFSVWYYSEKDKWSVDSH